MDFSTEKIKSNKMAVIIGIIVVVLISLVIFNAIIFNNNKEADQNILQPSQTLEAKDYEIEVEDYYQANYLILDDIGLNYTFDKYVAVDLAITNITEEEQKFIAFDHFFMDDGTEEPRHFIIDENEKKFSSELSPGETFNITLTFPVYENNTYTLYFNDTMKKEDEFVQGFTLNATNLEVKDVEQTTDHDLYNKLKKKIIEDEEKKDSEKTNKESTAKEEEA